MTRLRTCALAALAVCAAAGLAGCLPDSRAVAVSMTGGDPDRGRTLIRQYGCHTCHTIPGVRGADAVVGPPLDRIGVRTYLGGSLANSPENLIRWIRAPQSIRPGTAMPDTGVGERDGRDIAAYLYTLR